MSEAIYMAKDILEDWLVEAENDKEDIPVASSPEKLYHSTNVTAGTLLISIEVVL